MKNRFKNIGQILQSLFVVGLLFVSATKVQSAIVSTNVSKPVSEIGLADVIFELTDNIWRDETGNGVRVFEFTSYNLVNMVEELDNGQVTHSTFTWALRETAGGFLLALTDNALNTISYRLESTPSGFMLTDLSNGKAMLLRGKAVQ
jgi:hypothetical protein